MSAKNPKSVRTIYSKFCKQLNQTEIQPGPDGSDRDQINDHWAAYADRLAKANKPYQMPLCAIRPTGFGVRPKGKEPAANDASTIMKIRRAVMKIQAALKRRYAEMMKPKPQRKMGTDTANDLWAEFADRLKQASKPYRMPTIEEHRHRTRSI